MNNICKNTSFFLILIFFSKLLVSNNSYVRTSDFDPALTKKKQRNKYTNESNFQQLNFIENKGQILSYDGSLQPSVKFVFQQGNTQLFLLQTGIAYQFTKTDYPEGFSNLIKDKSSLKDFSRLEEIQKQVRIETFRMDMTLVGANKDPIITKEGKSVDFSNYYNRNVLDVHSYNKITYHNIYPGIDWVIYSVDGAVKYDFIVKPGADPSLIKMEFKHHEQLTLNEDGSFTLKNVMGSITEKKPLSFQNQNRVATRFKMKGNQISFVIDNYNTNQKLIIDPALDWATYYGGVLSDHAYWSTTDAFGNVFLSGSTPSTANIASVGHQIVFGGGGSDAYLVKFNANGMRLWATYYGGTGGEGSYCCASDALGNIYLSGITTSTSNIASGGHQNIFGGGVTDAFLVKFDSNGQRLWSTYYGGSDYDDGLCSVDALGNVYLAGVTSSSLNIASGGFLNTYSGNADAFLVKFNASGVRQWATYYGSTGVDFGLSCSNDASGNVYLAGSSDSPSNIASGGHQNVAGGLDDAFLVKFNTNGLRIWATYYGGSGVDKGLCKVDANGNIYLFGTTSSISNISSGGHQNTTGGANDGFLVKFSNSGLRLWASYYGGAGNDNANSCATDNSGGVYLSGTTSSTTNIALTGYQNSIGGGNDAFLVKFSSVGLRLWGTYFGGSASDLGNSCATDAFGNVYIAGDANSSSNISSGGHQNIIGGGVDAFLTRFCDNIPGQPSSISGNSQVCSLTNQTYTTTPVNGATSYSWLKPSGWLGTSSTNSIGVIPLATGVLSVSANNACGASPLQTLNIIVKPTPTISIISSSSLICEGENSTLTVSGAASFTWNSGVTNSTFIVSPILTTNYSVIGSNPNGCSNTKSLTVSVNPCTNLDENSDNNITIDIYPNPNNGLLQVKLEHYENTSLSIYDLMGKRIFDTLVKQNILSIDINHFANGMYLCVIRRDKEILKQVKVVKE